MLLEVLKRSTGLVIHDLHILLPVPPTSNKLSIVFAFTDHPVCNRKKDRWLRAWIRRQPVVSVGSRVGQAGVKDYELRAVLLALDNPLSMRIEVVTRL